MENNTTTTADEIIKEYRIKVATRVSHFLLILFLLFLSAYFSSLGFSALFVINYVLFMASFFRRANGFDILLSDKSLAQLAGIKVRDKNAFLVLQQKLKDNGYLALTDLHLFSLKEKAAAAKAVRIDHSGAQALIARKDY